MVDASALIAEAETRGARFEIVGAKLRAVPAKAITPELNAAIGANKAAVIAELRRRWTLGGSLCRRCNGIAVVRVADGVCRQCVGIEEWHIDGCRAFTVLATADVDAECDRGACLACGAPWSMHASPDPTSWRRVSDADDAVPAATRFVLASAREIVRAATR